MMGDASMREGNADARVRKQTDVCLIVEGCYPYVAGGVSSWVDWLMRTQPDLTFSVIAISSGHERRQPRYQPPPNQVAQYDLLLNAAPSHQGRRVRLGGAGAASRLAPVLSSFIDGGGLAE